MAPMAQAPSRRQKQQLWEDLLEIIATDLVPLRLERENNTSSFIKGKPHPFLWWGDWG